MPTAGTSPSCGLDDDGRLQPLQAVDAGGEVMPLALSPGRDRLYAARRSEPRAVLSFAIDAGSGDWRLLGAAPCRTAWPTSPPTAAGGGCAALRTAEASSR